MLIPPEAEHGHLLKEERRIQTRGITPVDAIDSDPLQKDEIYQSLNKMSQQESVPPC